MTYLCRYCGKPCRPQAWCAICGGDGFPGRECYCQEFGGACDPGRCRPGVAFLELPPKPRADALRIIFE